MLPHDTLLTTLDSVSCADPAYRMALWQKRPIAIFQPDRSVSVPYDAAYFEKYESYKGSEIANKINAARVAMVRGRGDTLLDVGIGAAEFLESVEPWFKTKLGFDVNKVAEAWLKSRAQWFDPFDIANDPSVIDVWSMFDVLEHLSNPQELLCLVRSGAFVAISIPIFSDDVCLEEVLVSKHHKPNEHVVWFSKFGLIKYFQLSGFDLVEYNDHETAAGRESIGSFCFVKR